jgi:outer membrane protein OmpA-like peptidoglycan-associated protein
MAKLLDARDPGFRIMSAFGSTVLCVALALSGARLVAADEVEVNLDVLKTLPAGKSGEASKAITLTPPKATNRTVGRREEALRRARKKRLIEQAKRKATARRKAEAARKAAARKKAEEARKAEEAKQSEELERKAKADREDAAARAAQAAREAEAAKKAEAAQKANAAKAAQKAKAAKAAADSKAAKARDAKPAVVPQKAPVTEATKATTKTKAATGAKKQVATRTARIPLSRARLLFGKESAALSKAEKDKLKPIAARMISEEKALLVIYAYAAGDGSNTSDARRLSLSRALAVRRAITGHGIPTIRTEIRALGARAGEGPSDRVDLVLVQR